MPTPTGAEPRLAAAKAVAAVLDRGRALDDALAEDLRGLDKARDRALARRLSHALMRDWPAANFLVTQLVARRPARRDRLVHFILAIALVELRQAREPARAVVHSAVESADRAGLRHLRGLVNAVLRNYQRRQAELQRAMPSDPVHRLGYPGWLLERIRSDWPEDWERILTAGNASPPLWLRVNRRRWSIDQARQALTDVGLDTRMVAGLPDALVLDRRVAISELPGFEEGRLSIQDGAAQATVEYLRLEPGLRVLDACAAPGGKSAHVLEREALDLTAVEIDPRRLERVSATFDRLGLSARVLVGDAAEPQTWWDGVPYDRILIDAPCSASGVIRRHPDIRWLRRPDDLKALVRLQARLLDGLWPLLRPGGILVYATCSILKAENEAQAQRFLEQHADARILHQPGRPGHVQTPGHQILPGEGDMDGFYHLAVERLHRGS
ncbi:16S rRNA (cytosine(967)-C(5))-methyltransferase RsmB [Wenzhouxiangella limi]|uniref:16S rRNA (cytosine(967)-C(5))-methyltransferase n=1 Tax=Wenzhouxiangella limi TaxID=2707351 RepID=A0A845UZI7_9GAMM|nr:16S rRNA (cytosine(967)-C(5))-methyltransferase RsmB [Wenzhouxiangella limi]NDY95894.1 16S rRNA (cytosine(967)-C(5))-methyltransferase RsmB [Wenzhouxiangella limi]